MGLVGGVRTAGSGRSANNSSGPSRSLRKLIKLFDETAHCTSHSELQDLSDYATIAETASTYSGGPGSGNTFQTLFVIQ